jgi:hypothetical protein
MSELDNVLLLSLATQKGHAEARYGQFCAPAGEVAGKHELVNQIIYRCRVLKCSPLDG